MRAKHLRPVFTFGLGYDPFESAWIYHDSSCSLLGFERWEGHCRRILLLSNPASKYVIMVM